MATFLVVITVLACSNCWQYYSLDAYLFREKIDRCKLTIFPIRQLQVFVSLLYLFSWIAKLNHGWFSGEILESMHYVHTIKGVFAKFFFSFIPYKAATGFTLFAEGFLIFALWFKQTRLLAIFVGVIFHLSLDATMGVATFSYQM